MPLEKNPVSGLVADAIDLVSANPISRASRPASTALRNACAIRWDRMRLQSPLFTRTAQRPFPLLPPPGLVRRDLHPPPPEQLLVR